jgi:hypothetical protein
MPKSAKWPTARDAERRNRVNGGLQMTDGKRWTANGGRVSRAVPNNYGSCRRAA